MSRPRHRNASFRKHGEAAGGLLGALVLLAIVPAPAAAYPLPGITERVSVNAAGADGNKASSGPATSADGRYVAFSSAASNLVPADTNGLEDVFVRDRGAGTTQRVSVASGGAQAEESSSDPAISAGGRYVAFGSYAPNLVPGDTNGQPDVFVRDRETGTTERVSVASGGAEGNGGPSSDPAISADGRYVAFYSDASDLVPGDTNAWTDVFVRDREAGTTERVSVASGGGQASDGPSYVPALSADGRYVAFYSFATNLVTGDTNRQADVFVRDRQTGTTERASVASGGAQGNGGISYVPALSADGRYVAFASAAVDLVPGDSNGQADVFVRDRQAGTTERVSVSSDGVEGDGYSYDPAISADGRHVAFHGGASNLVPGDTNYAYDVFVRDREAGTTERVSVTSEGAEGNGFLGSAISADGRYAAFANLPTNPSPGDPTSHVFIRDRGGSLGVVGGLSVAEVPGGVSVVGRARFSAAAVTGSTDPPDDGEVAARDLGAELTGGALIYRPEQEDLLLRLDLAFLPPAAGGLPGILYGLEFGSGGTTFEVRALRAGATSIPPQVPHVALYRCAPSCTEHAPLIGSFGTTGEQVLVSVPLSALGATEGTELTGLRAFTALGEASTGALHPMDEVPLSSSVIPTPRMELGIAFADRTEDEVVFDAVAYPSGGGFSGTIPTSSLPPGSHRVWARACVGTSCGPGASTGLTL